MLKKTGAILLIVALCLQLFACTAKKSADVPFKIGLMTGTVAQGEEEYRAAQKLKEKYGDYIVHITYPDNFVKEQETTMANLSQLAADPQVKAIVMCIGITGATAAFERVRRDRPDLLLICANTVEDPDVLASIADIVIHPDEINMGRTIVQQAAAMGAKSLVHYSFPRHMASPLYRERLNIMREQCQTHGITLLEETCPDPMGDLGISGAQMFIFEDIAAKVKQYGKDTCFFNTNCSMQEPLIKAALDNGAIVAQQCCPSPYHGYPAALGIEAGDTQEVIENIRHAIVEKGGGGRFSTWKLPANMLMIEASVEYAVQYLNGQTNGKNDSAALTAIFDSLAGSGSVSLSNYQSLATGQTVSNMYMLLEEYITFE